MKNTFSKKSISTICALTLVGISLFGCEGKQTIHPGGPAPSSASADAVVSEWDFDGTLLQALEAVDEKSYCKVAKVEAGYSITVIPGHSTQERTVCSGGGLGFVKCVKGYVDGGSAVTVVRCVPGPYCGNIL
jgi:hypothetical protein